MLKQEVGLQPIHQGLHTILQVKLSPYPSCSLLQCIHILVWWSGFYEQHDTILNQCVTSFITSADILGLQSTLTWYRKMGLTQFSNIPKGVNFDDILHRSGMV